MPNVSLVDGHIDGKQTNYDRIRNMSIEEMANYIFNIAEDCHAFCTFTEHGKCINYGGAENCIIGIKEWLETEV